MIYLGFIVVTVMGLSMVSILVKKEKLIIDTKTHTWAVGLSMSPLFIMIAYYLYKHTASRSDWMISCLGVMLGLGGMSAFLYFAKDKSWVKYLLLLVSLSFIAIGLLLNHFSLVGYELTGVITLVVVVTINLYRITSKNNGHVLAMGILSIVICIAIFSMIENDLRLDTTVARTVIDYSVNEGIVDEATDIIVRDTGVSGIYEVMLFHKRAGETLTTTTDFIYNHSDVYLLE